MHEISLKFYSKLARACLTAWLVLMAGGGLVGPLHMQWADGAAGGFFIAVAAAGIRRRLDRAFVTWTLVYLLTLVLSLNVSPVELVKGGTLAVLGLTTALWALVPDEWERTARVYAGVVAAVIVMVLLTWLLQVVWGKAPADWVSVMAVPNVGNVARVKMAFYTPTMLANYLTAGVPVLAAIVAVQRPGSAVWFVLLLGILATATTASHSLAGCLLAAGLIAPRATAFEQFGRRLLLGLAAATVAFGLFSTTVCIAEVRSGPNPAAEVAVAWPVHVVPGSGRVREVLATQVHYAWVSYGQLKRLAWEAWLEHPLFGIGLGRFSAVATAAFEEGRLHARALAPHSTWFGALAETGLVGMVGLLGFWVMGLRPAWRVLFDPAQPQAWRVRAPMAGLCGLLINGVHVDIMHFRFLWLGVALAVAATAQTEKALR